MSENNDEKELQKIVYSCYAYRSRAGEQFIPEHIFAYQISGSLVINDGTKDIHFNEGDFRFYKRNHLIKFIKYPPENGEFKTLTIYFDQEILRKFSIEYGFSAERHQEGDAVLQLKSSPLYKGFMESLQPYDRLDFSGKSNLQALKLKEALLILLEANPELKNTLFDFSEPGKIDLEAFMNSNFHFNVKLNRFAYLTGRSLATFKRDFEKIFSISPSRWLQQKRLQEAHYLIKEKGKAPSDVYLDLGFEDLSHFSFAFKKTYGVAPSRI